MFKLLIFPICEKISFLTFVLFEIIHSLWSGQGSVKKSFSKILAKECEMVKGYGIKFQCDTEIDKCVNLTDRVSTFTFGVTKKI
jgi:hypothetical protein